VEEVDILLKGAILSGNELLRFQFVDALIFPLHKPCSHNQVGEVGTLLMRPFVLAKHSSLDAR